MNLIQFIATFFCLVAGTCASVGAIMLRRAVKLNNLVGQQLRLAGKARRTGYIVQPYLDTTAQDLQAHSPEERVDL